MLSKTTIERPPPASADVCTPAEAARRHGLQTWQVRRIFERGDLPPAPRVGAYRVVPAADLWRVEAALRNAGYLPKTEAARCVS